MKYIPALILLVAGLAISVAFQNCGEGFKAAAQGGAAAGGSLGDVFAQQPASQSVSIGGAVTLSGRLQVESGVQYQWEFRATTAIGFVPIGGATLNQLVFSAIKSTDMGDYRLVATQGAQTFTSNIATLSPKSGSTSCLLSDLKMIFPVQCVLGTNCTLVNYNDLDPGPGVLDYSGKKDADAISYNARAGIRIGIANFQVMEQGVVVLAPVDSVIEQVENSQPDHILVPLPSDTDNFVQLRAANGFSIRFRNLRLNGATLVPGTAVKAGDPVGFVGSSGMSNLPSVTMEVRDCSGALLDPAKEGLFSTAIPYEPAVGFISNYQRTSSAFNSVEDTISVSGPSVNTAAAGTKVYFANVLAHVFGGDVLTTSFYKPDGSKSFDITHTISTARRFYGQYHNWGYFTLTLDGVYKIENYVNAKLVRTGAFTVTGGTVGSGRKPLVRHYSSAIPDHTYTATTTTATVPGYVLEGPIFYVEPSPTAFKMKSLNLCTRNNFTTPQGPPHFVSVGVISDPNPCEGEAGTVGTLLGYVSAGAFAGSVPIYRCYSTSLNRHVITTNDTLECTGAFDIKEGIIGYADSAP